MYNPPVTFTLVYVVGDVETVYSLPNIPLTLAYEKALECAFLPSFDELYTCDIEDCHFTYNQWLILGFPVLQYALRYTDAENIAVIRRECEETNTALYFLISHYDEQDDETISVASSTDAEESEDVGNEQQTFTFVRASG